jgi:hypothetical protein
MSSLQLRSDFKNNLSAFVESNWPGTPIVDDYNDFRSKDDIIPGETDTWISVLFYEYETRQSSLGPPGSRSWRENGMIVLNVFVPSGDGDSDLLTMVEALKTRYRGLQIGDLVCLTASGPDQTILSEAHSSRGNWFGYSIDIEYRYDFCEN